MTPPAEMERFLDYIAGRMDEGTSDPTGRAMPLC